MQDVDMEDNGENAPLIEAIPDSMDGGIAYNIRDEPGSRSCFHAGEEGPAITTMAVETRPDSEFSGAYTVSAQRYFP
jgi:hypothetical protein